MEISKETRNFIKKLSLRDFYAIKNDNYGIPEEFSARKMVCHVISSTSIIHPVYYVSSHIVEDGIIIKVSNRHNGKILHTFKATKI